MKSLKKGGGGSMFSNILYWGQVRTAAGQSSPRTLFFLSQAFGMCQNVVLHGLLEQCLDVPGKDVALKAAYVAVKSQ